MFNQLGHLHSQIIFNLTFLTENKKLQINFMTVLYWEISVNLEYGFTIAGSPGIVIFVGIERYENNNQQHSLEQTHNQYQAN